MFVVDGFRTLIPLACIWILLEGGLPCLGLELNCRTNQRRIVASSPNGCLFFPKAA